MSTPTRIMRAPSVEDYARMTQAARVSAARLVEEQMRLIEKRRAELRATKTAEAELTGALVRSAAQIAFDALDHDPPDKTLERQMVLTAALNPARRKAAA